MKCQECEGGGDRVVDIRPFQDNDGPLVDHLLQQSWGHDPTMLAIYRVHRSGAPPPGRIRHTHVATVDGKVVGVGTLADNALHPRVLTVIINVAPGWQRRRVGSALYAALSRLSDGRPWLAKITLRDHAGTAFLRKRGFRPVVRTLTGVLDPQRTSVHAWMAGLPASVPGCRVAVLGEPGLEASVEDLALTHAAVYRRFHSWNPPVEEGTPAALAHYCGSDVIGGSHLYAWTADRLIGVANLIADPFLPDSNDAYLVNLGVADPTLSFESDLTAALVRRILEIAAGRGLRVRFEVDSSNMNLWSLLDRAPAVETNSDFMIMSNG